MIFPNISFVHMVVTDWTGPLKLVYDCDALQFCRALSSLQFCRKSLLLKTLLRVKLSEKHEFRIILSENLSNPETNAIY
jgi:hypothetical protein